MTGMAIERDFCKLTLARQPGIVLEAVGARGCNPRLGGGNRRGLGPAETHVQPHLAIGDVAAGQGAVPHRREEPLDTQSAVIAGCATCFAGGPPPRTRPSSGGARPPPPNPPRLLLFVFPPLPPPSPPRA